MICGQQTEGQRLGVSRGGRDLQSRRGTKQIRRQYEKT